MDFMGFIGPNPSHIDRTAPLAYCWPNPRTNAGAGGARDFDLRTSQVLGCSPKWLLMRRFRILLPLLRTVPFAAFSDAPETNRRPANIRQVLPTPQFHSKMGYASENQPVFELTSVQLRRRQRPKFAYFRNSYQTGARCQRGQKNTWSPAKLVADAICPRSDYRPFFAYFRTPQAFGCQWFIELASLLRTRIIGGDVIARKGKYSSVFPLVYFQNSSR